MAVFVPSCSQLLLGSPMLVRARPPGHIKNSGAWHQALCIPLLPAPPSHLGLGRQQDWGLAPRAPSSILQAREG